MVDVVRSEPVSDGDLQGKYRDFSRFGRTRSDRSGLNPSVSRGLGDCGSKLTGKSSFLPCLRRGWNMLAGDLLNVFGRSETTTM